MARAKHAGKRPEQVVKIYKNVYEKMKEKADEKGRTQVDFMSEQVMMNLERYDKLAKIAPNYAYSLGEGDSFMAIRCKKEDKTFYIYSRDSELWCEQDKSKECFHVIYALATPEVSRLWTRNNKKNISDAASAE